jgi:ubiquinone/menaquinone biosynthesis C-methylase UbiE
MSAFFPFELEPPPRLYRLLARGALMQRLYRRVAADLAAALPTGGLLIDVGAGPGHLLRHVAVQRPDLRLAGVDFSYAMLRGTPDPLPSSGDRRIWRANERLQDNRRFLLPYRLVGNSAALPLRTGCCDLAVSTFSFHTWNNPVQGVQEMRRLLKPGGQAWIYEMNREAVWEQWRALAREEKLPTLFVGAGFKLLSWNHALRSRDFAATFEQAEILPWQLGPVHHLFWRAIF